MKLCMSGVARQKVRVGLVERFSMSDLHPQAQANLNIQPAHALHCVPTRAKASWLVMSHFPALHSAGMSMELKKVLESPVFLALWSVCDLDKLCISWRGALPNLSSRLQLSRKEMRVMRWETSFL